MSPETAAEVRWTTSGVKQCCSRWKDAGGQQICDQELGEVTLGVCLANRVPGSSRLHSPSSWCALGRLIAAALHSSFSRRQHRPAAGSEGEMCCSGAVPHGLALSWVALGQSCCFFAHP